MKRCFFLLLAPISRYPKIARQAQEFFISALGDRRHRPTIVNLFHKECGRTDWSTKLVCIMGYRNEVGVVLPTDPNDSNDKKDSAPKTSPRKEIISAVLFTHHARDGCFIHYVGTKCMSPDLSFSVFGSGPDQEGAWTSQHVPQDQQARGDSGVFRHCGLARYLLHLTQVCTVFDPGNVNMKLWLDSTKGSSNFHHRLGFRSDQNIFKSPHPLPCTIINPMQ